MAYCYYQLDDFVNAADCYEQLTLLHPHVDDYKLYYAQTLYKANLCDEAMKISSQIDNPAYRPQVALNTHNTVDIYFPTSLSRYFPKFCCSQLNIAVPTLLRDVILGKFFL